ncbi:MAG: hypothetical protein F2520_11420 [Actinobacteria bacterium]|nr:hypothetical protein [Actinomycetota bacterium]
MTRRLFGSRRVAPSPAPVSNRPRAVGGRTEPVASNVPARHRWSLGRATMVSVGIFITVAIFVLGVMPTRQWINNRRAIAAAESTLAELEARNEQDTAAADSLRSGAELERLAREQYGYARPGEEVYHVLPAPRDPVRVPGAWPFTALGSSISR